MNPKQKSVTLGYRFRIGSNDDLYKHDNEISVILVKFRSFLNS